LWHCTKDQWQEARALLEATIQKHPEFAEARAVLGLVFWKGLNQPAAAWIYLQKALLTLQDGQLYVHADTLLKELGRVDERVRLLESWPLGDFRKRETQIDIALQSGDPEEAMRLLTMMPWKRHHGRYRRSQLWQAARDALGLPRSTPPNFLGEDPLEVEG
jgi:hypothetical protein